MMRGRVDWDGVIGIAIAATMVVMIVALVSVMIGTTARDTRECIEWETRPGSVTSVSPGHQISPGVGMAWDGSGIGPSAGSGMVITTKEQDRRVCTAYATPVIAPVANGEDQ